MPPRRDSSNETGLSERPLVQALEALSLWPPELSQDDKSEIFHSLLIPSAGERTGTDKTKHFFVLPALPRGDPDGFATTAADCSSGGCREKCYRKGAPLMTDKEWQTLVLDLRTP